MWFYCKGSWLVRNSNNRVLLSSQRWHSQLWPAVLQALGHHTAQRHAWARKVWLHAQPSTGRNTGLSTLGPVKHRKILGHFHPLTVSFCGTPTWTFTHSTLTLSSLTLSLVPSSILCSMGLTHSYTLHLWHYHWLYVCVYVHTERGASVGWY